MLPAGIAVGSGCVIDSYGGTSRQMDVVLYEKALCPVYSVNDDPATTYYPCEGVLAVGEVKSALGSAELEDAFAKIASVKQLRRFVQPSDDATPFRAYGSSLSIQGTEEQAFNEDKPLDQIFGFCIADRLILKAETACERYGEFANQTGVRLSPNLIVTLDDHVLCPLDVSEPHKPKIMVSAAEANTIYCVTYPPGVFQFLLSRVYTVYRQGRTVEEVAFDRYFATRGRLSLPRDGASSPLN